MKKYTFTIDKNTNRTNNFRTESTNYSKIISDTIAANIIKNNPYLAGSIDPEYRGAIYIPKTTKKETTIDITIPARRKSIDIDILLNKKKDTGIYDFDRLSKAIKFLANYDSAMDDYDFKTDDGTPIKLFADEIQIGYDLIPLNAFTKSIYDSLSESTKKSIIDIYITINKN